MAGCSSADDTTTPPTETTQDAPQTTDKEDAAPAEPVETADELEGEITFWHSFTQGPRLERIQAAADSFMEKHPKVKINIETYSWADFYTKWTTGLASGNVPDMSTAQAGQVVEMINADAIIPLDDMIDEIGRDRFYESPIQEMTYDGSCYAVPIYSHAFVMWYRKDLLEKYNLDVPRLGTSSMRQRRRSRRARTAKFTAALFRWARTICMQRASWMSGLAAAASPF